MTQLKIYNTMSGQREEFLPIGSPVRMYVCGITPYASSHFGHAMFSIVFDVVRRYLEFRGFDVKHVQNYTDVDDRIIARAQARGETPNDYANRYIAEYEHAMKYLNVLPAHVNPRVTEEMPEIVALVGELVGRGAAYASGGDVYYRVAADEDYGKLSRRRLDEMIAGARVEIGELKEHPADFALWKAAKPGEVSWESPWGPGRPGWHIECSAMSRRYLGPQIDIHGGGQDLIFPHHENEIAQTEAATGLVPFARYWMHNGFIQFSGEKMSKSIGNVVTLNDAIERHSADAIRTYILQSHYRSPLNYADESIEGAARGVERLVAALRTVDTALPPGPPTEFVSRARESFVAAMDDDFNTTVALSVLFDLAREINRRREAGDGAGASEAGTTLRELANVLGLRLKAADDRTATLDVAPFVELLLEIRRDLRAAKQYQLADRVRDRLGDLGIAVEDRADGSLWRRT